VDRQPLRQNVKIVRSNELEQGRTKQPRDERDWRPGQFTVKGAFIDMEADGGRDSLGDSGAPAVEDNH
jgi:hypothetical protein